MSNIAMTAPTNCGLPPTVFGNKSAASKTSAKLNDAWLSLHAHQVST